MDRIPIGERPKRSSNVARLPGTDETTPGPDEDMSYEEALAAAPAEGQDDPASEPTSPPAAEIVELVERAVRVAAGMFAACASALGDGLRVGMPADTAVPAGDPSVAVGRATGAALGAAVIAADAAAQAAKELAETIGPAMTWLAEPRVASEASDLAAGLVRVLDGRWKASQAEAIDEAATFLGVLVPAVVHALAEKVDLTALVREHVDLRATLDDADFDRLAERIARKVAEAERASPPDPT